MVKPTTRPTTATERSDVHAPTAKARMLEPHEIVLASAAQSGIGILGWSKFAGEPDPSTLCQDIQDEIKKVAVGDMFPVEAILYGQALTLQTIFTALSRRAAGNEGLKQFQVNLTLALKAQAQCRATLEALAEIKNPRPVSFVKQANITSGPQQVNNAGSAAQGLGRHMPDDLETDRALPHPENRSCPLGISNAAEVVEVK